MGLHAIDEQRIFDGRQPVWLSLWLAHETMRNARHALEQS